MKASIRLFLIINLLLITFSCKKETANTTTNVTIEDTVFLKARVGSLVEFKADLKRVTIDTVNSELGKLTKITAYSSDNFKMIIMFDGRDTGKYLLGSTINLNYISVYNNTLELWRTITNGGLLTVTKYDTVNHKMSGTFNADLRKTTSDFDYQFIERGEFKDLTITGF